MWPKGMIDKSDSIQDALSHAFSWDYSREGVTYWMDIVKDLIDGTYHFTAAESAGRAAGLPESVCEEAQRIQGGDRQQDYGSPAKNFQDIADLWSTYLKVALDVDVDIKARDVAHMSILMKVSRNVHKPKRDNWVDMAGYAQCGGKVDEL
tara:strand:+ start:117 stop:566 length:450 start_codon:yes stop_codon:yes gene_type:complete